MAKEKTLVDQIKKKRNKGFIQMSDYAQMYHKGIEMPLALQILLTANVFPLDIMTELWGEEGYGKTTLMLHLGTYFVKSGGTVFYIDAEQKGPYDIISSWYNEDTIQIFQPKTAAEAAENISESLEIMESWNKKIVTETVNRKKVETVKQVPEEEQAPALIILDSLPATITSRETSGGIDYGTQSMAAYAQAWGKPIRDYTGRIAMSNTVISFINHARSTIGQGASFKDTPGGKHLRHMMTIRFQLLSSKKSEGNEIWAKMRTAKNSGGSPMKAIDRLHFKWEGRTNFVYEFGTALGQLLSSDLPSNPDKSPFGELKDLSFSGDKFSSDSLGFKKIAGEELEAAIDEHPDVKRAIQEFYGVAIRPIFGEKAEEDKQFKCEFCDKSYKREGDRDNHVEKEHN